MLSCDFDLGVLEILTECGVGEEADQAHVLIVFGDGRVGGGSWNPDDIAGSDPVSFSFDPHLAAACLHVHDLLRERMTMSTASLGSFEFDQSEARLGRRAFQRIGRAPSGEILVLVVGAADDAQSVLRNARIASTRSAIAAAVFDAKSRANSEVAQLGFPYQPSSSISVTSVM